MTDGQGELQKAKLFNNTIQPYFFDIPLHQVILGKADWNKHAPKLQVCLPGLHITLGIFFCLFSLLEDECHCSDLEVAKPDDRTTFATYASSLHQRASLQEEKDQLTNLINTINQVITYLALNLPNPQQNPGLQAACQQKLNTEKRINEIVSIKGSWFKTWCDNTMYTQRKELTRIDKVVKKEFVKSQGPFVKGLDKALDSFNVYRQAYYSGTFVGNHVHTSLKVSDFLAYSNKNTYMFTSVHRRSILTQCVSQWWWLHSRYALISLLSQKRFLPCLNRT